MLQSPIAALNKFAHLRRQLLAALQHGLKVARGQEASGEQQQVLVRELALGKDELGGVLGEGVQHALVQAKGRQPQVDVVVAARVDVDWRRGARMNPAGSTWRE